MKKQVLSILILIFTACITNAQTDATLAQQFMSNGEYDKAADIYKKLFNENSNSNYKPYYNCLMLLNDFKEIERIAEKQMKKNPDNLTYYVDLGNAFIKQGNKKEAEKQFDIAIQKISDNKQQVIQLANAFIGLDNLERAITVYEKGQKIVSNHTFNYDLAGLYYRIKYFRSFKN